MYVGKIKNLIEEQKNDLKKLFFNYTFTIIAVHILPLFIIFVNNICGIFLTVSGV